MIQKGIISPFTKWLISLLAILPSILCVIGQAGAPAQQPFPPASALNFTDKRLAAVYSVIQNFKNTITSDPLGITQNWVGPDICNYTGFYCDNPPDNLSAIALASVDFNGYQLGAPTLDGFIDQLPDLALFHANSNNFTGTISTKIANLLYFYELDISNNKFLGEFPQALLTAGLFFLDIRFNFFTGKVPLEVFTQPLSVLFINNNRFMQRLPENFGNIPALYITFANNKFTGPIPASIGNASRLTEILFLDNLFTGCIPIEIGFLKNATVFDAGNNLLTGPLPYSLGCLEKIEQLNLAGNFLFGEVPELVCELENLKNLSLSDNYFSIVGPRCWKLIKSGVLDLRNNCIHGLPDQRSLLECWWFFFYPIHRHCQYPWWFTTHVPCFVPHKKHHPPIGSKRKLLSYAALSRNRVFEDQQERIALY